MPHENITTLYSSVCESCGGYTNESTSNLFTDAEIDNLVEGVYTRLYTKDNLPEWYYVAIALALFSGVESGFGLTLSEVEVGSLEYEYLIAFQENVYVFSAAKTYQMVGEIQDLLTRYGDNEELFKIGAKKIFYTYNTPKGANYLSTEYQSAKRQAQMARKWLFFEENSYQKGCLKYITKRDNRVRPEHIVLDGIEKPIGDVFWTVYYPPNDWGCRCDVEAVVCGLSNNYNNIKNSNVPDAFRFNSGQQRKVFSPKHAYFEVRRGDKELAKRNFNLPLP